MLRFQKIFKSVDFNYQHLTQIKFYDVNWIAL